MEKTQRVIVVLLVLAIVFSAVSIFIGYVAVTGIELPGSVQGNSIKDDGAGSLSFVVEESNLGGNG